MGPPAPITRAYEAQALLERLDEVSHHLDAWLVFPPDIQHALIGLTGALARYVQDEVDLALPAESRDLLHALFPALTHWSKRYRPGFVPALSRRFGPEHGSWLEDARQWWSWLLEQAHPPPIRERLP